MTFYGNPNVTVSSINTGGGIVCSRTSGTAPFFFQVCASGITAPGTSVPYQDLDYSWNFGDPTGTEIFVNPGVGGGIVNANTDQLGPGAAYVYRSPGTYTVTLTIRANKGSIVAQVTQNITVSAFVAGATLYVDSVNGNDSNSGADSNHPKQSLSAINTFLAAGGSNLALFLAYGSNWAGSVPLALGGTVPNTAAGIAGLQMQPYGTVGANPKFTFSGNGSDNCFEAGNGAGGSTTSGKTNILISHIDFESTESGGKTVVRFAFSNPNVASACSDIYFDNCNVTGNTGGGCSGMEVFNSADDKQTDRVGFWNVYVNGAIPSVGTNGVFCDVGLWQFFIGGGINGGGGAVPDVRLHHYYPIVQQHFAAHWINFGAGANRNCCINLDWDGNGVTLEYADYANISQCGVTGTATFHDAGARDNNPTTVQWRNVVCQLNRIHDLTGFGAAIFTYNLIDYTHRYNQAWKNDGDVATGSSYMVLNGGATQKNLFVGRIYFNQLYFTISQDNYVFGWIFSDLTQGLTLTDNSVMCAAAFDPNKVSISWATQTAAGAIIDRNDWWFPGATTSSFQFRDGTTPKTFLDWRAQGYDINGRVANPNWIDPANGNFNISNRDDRILGLVDCEW